MNNVLIVDADVVSRNLVARSLTEAGRSVLEAANPFEALRLADAFKARIQLAVICGREVIEVVTKLYEIRPDIPIYVAPSESKNQIFSSGTPVGVHFASLDERSSVPLVLEHVCRILSRVG